MEKSASGISPCKSFDANERNANVGRDDNDDRPANDDITVLDRSRDRRLVATETSRKSISIELDAKFKL